MKTAIVTGASSGIGENISLLLSGRGFKVYGIARWTKGRPDNPDCEPVVLDLRDPGAIQQELPGILERLDSKLDLLVNAAGFGRFAPHRSLDPIALQEMVTVNLTAPMLLCRLCLPALEKREGKIINVSSITARHLGKRGAAYAATKAGLLHFSRNLFEEIRKSGVSVTTLLPDLTNTPFYESLDFAPANEPGAAVDIHALTAAVRQVLDAPPGTVLEEIVLRPQVLRIDKRKRGE